MAISSIDLGWAAGFLEGEGSFSHYMRGNCAVIHVVAMQLEDEPLRRLMGLFGGNLDRRPGRTRGRYSEKPIYRWRLGGGRAAGLMMTMWPLMTLRRRGQIELALTAWKGNRSSRNTFPMHKRRACPNGHVLSVVGIRWEHNGKSAKCAECHRQWASAHNKKKWASDPEYRRKSLANAARWRERQKALDL